MLTVLLSAVMGMSSVSAKELCWPGFGEGGGCGDLFFGSVSFKLT